MNNVAYPRFIKRFRALLVDSVVLPIAVIGTLVVGDAMGVTSGFGKAMLFFLPIFILEPCLVAFTGGTIGHHLMGIRVARIGGAGNLNLVSAVLRYIVKLLLGGVSLIFVFITTKHQALHDLLARSVLIHSDISGLPAYEVLSERIVDRSSYDYPAPWRRVLVSLLYWLLATVALFIAIAVGSSDACLQGMHCTGADKLVDVVSSLAWVVCIGWLTVRGWNGRLYGCRRTARKLG